MIPLSETLASRTGRLIHPRIFDAIVTNVNSCKERRWKKKVGSGKREVRLVLNAKLINALIEQGYASNRFENSCFSLVTRENPLSRCGHFDHSICH